MEPDDGDTGDPREQSGPRRMTERDRERALAKARIQHQHSWVDLQIRQAEERGDFDNLSGAGKPLELGSTHDPDWWVKRLIEREQIQGVAPEAILLRRDDRELDARLDRENVASEVRRIVAEFNARVVEARRQLLGGPPVVTDTRDPDQEVERWRERRRRTPQPAAEPTPEPKVRVRRRWWRR